MSNLEEPAEWNDAALRDEWVSLKLKSETKVEFPMVFKHSEYRHDML